MLSVFACLFVCISSAGRVYYSICYIDSMMGFTLLLAACHNMYVMETDNVSSIFFHRLVAPLIILVFHTNYYGEIPRYSLTGTSKICRCGMKKSRFSTNISLYLGNGTR